MLTICTNATRRSAGLLIISGRRVLLLKRAEDAGNPLTWGLPGGKARRREPPYAAALRESEEEMRRVPPHLVLGALAVQHGARRYEVIACRTARSIRDTWRPRLNHEHLEHKWAKLGWLEARVERLHPVLRRLLTEDEGREWFLEALRREPEEAPVALPGGRPAPHAVRVLAAG